MKNHMQLCNAAEVDKNVVTLRSMAYYSFTNTVDPSENNKKFLKLNGEIDFINSTKQYQV